MPPTESEIWPEQYRGKRWRPIYAKRFAGRCQLCAYSFPLPKLRQLLDEYVDVYRKGNKWRAGITCRGHHYFLGLFDDPVEAAKARDRKAYELHGPYAYLNFPEEFRPPGRK